jgi:putative oxidoreductase
MLKKLFAPGNDSLAANLGLLVLRVWLGATLLLNHGLAKLAGFSSMSSGFPDPFGIGHVASFTLVVFAEVVAAGLLALGLVTRFAALVTGFNMAVAFIYGHKLSLSGNHSGELAFIYLAGFVTLLLAGGGSISLDQSVFKGGGKKAKGGGD